MSLTLHKSRQVQCSGNMQWWACSSLNLLLCLQRQVTKLGSELFYSRPLLRNNELAPNPRRCPSNYGNRRFAACTAVLPTSRFSREFGLVVCQVAGFLNTCKLLVIGLVLFEICLFFSKFVFWRLLFFQILWHFWSFNLLLRAIWACFCENLLILGLFLLMCLIPAFIFNLSADLCFCWIFLPSPCWACFRLNYLFWAFVSNCLFLQSNLAPLMYGNYWTQTFWQVMPRDRDCW